MSDDNNSDNDKTQVYTVQPKKYSEDSDKREAEDLRLKYCYLIQYNGNEVGRSYCLEEDVEMVLGRHADTFFTVLDQNISRHHAKFFQKEGSVWVEDLSSSNGTFLNSIKLAPNKKFLLKNNDEIKFGALIFKFFDQSDSNGQIHDEIYTKATTDEGTKTYNKRHLLNSLEAQWRLSKIYNNDLSIIYFDLDHFKKLNDTHGHLAGDEVLRDLCKEVKNLIRKNDLLGRYGGEEFVIILPKTNKEKAIEMAERIRSHLSSHVFSLTSARGAGPGVVTPYTQTVSMGVEQNSDIINSKDELLNSADVKLYHSKKTGRNKVTG